MLILFVRKHYSPHESNIAYVISKYSKRSSQEIVAQHLVLKLIKRKNPLALMKAFPFPSVWLGKSLPELESRILAFRADAPFSQTAR